MTKTQKNKKYKELFSTYKSPLASLPVKKISIPKKKPVTTTKKKVPPPVTPKPDVTPSKKAIEVESDLV